MFSIANNLTTGVLFGVANGSGDALLAVRANGIVALAEDSGAVGVASTAPRLQPDTKLDVRGGVIARFFQNEQSLSEDYTAPDFINTFVAGPYTVDAGVTLTVGPDAVFSIL